MKRIMRSVLYYGVCIVLTCVFLFPFLVMLSGSLDAETKYVVTLTNWMPKQITFKLYAKVMGMGSKMLRWFFNSLVISVIPTITGVFLDALLGYIFAKKKFPGKNLIFWYFMMAIMVPYQATIVSNYLMFSKLGWLNHYIVFLIPGCWIVAYMFMMRQYIVTIPDELMEAARMDGAGEWKIFFTIILPLSAPALSTVAIFTFMNSWNNFMGPLIFTTSEKMYNLVVGLATLNQQSATFNTQMTAGVITFLPVFLLYLCLQRYFIDGLVMGGVKG